MENKIIIKDYLIADNILKRARGLMFRKKPKRILFKFNSLGKHSIHSFFVFFNFDAIYLDENLKVVEIFESISPNKLINPKKQAKYLFEAEEGFIKKNKIKLGSFLKF